MFNYTNKKILLAKNQISLATKMENKSKKYKTENKKRRK